MKNGNGKASETALKFADFLLDVETGELLDANGKVIKLQQQPVRVLILLASNSGKLVTREEIQQMLWNDEKTFVDFQQGINYCIKQIRNALNDTAKNPHFIETLPRRGYRFIAEVENQNGSAGDEKPQETILPEKELMQNDNVNEKIVKNTGKSFSLFRRKILSVSLAAAAVLFFLTFIFYLEHNKTSRDISEIRSIAILPFNQIGESHDAKFELGLADVLISNFSEQREISITPTASIIKFADRTDLNAAETGRKLEVDAVLTGTIQRNENVARVNIQLIRSKDESAVWVDKFDIEFSDVFSLQDKIAKRLITSFPFTLKDFSKLKTTGYTNNVDAFREYWMGMSFWSLHTPEGFENAVKHFKKALDFDSKFSSAHAYLADSYAHTGYVTRIISKEEALIKAEEEAKKALETDAANPEALAALALTEAVKGNQTTAHNLIKRSVEIMPNNSHSRHRLSWILANEGNLEQAVKEMEAARKLDPQSGYINLYLAIMLLMDKQPDNAIIYLNNSLNLDPDYLETRLRLVEALEQKGLYDEAETELKKIIEAVGENTTNKLVLSRLLAKKGETEAARRLLNETSVNGKIEKYFAALAYISLNETDKSLEILKKIAGEFTSDFYILRFDPNLDPVRNNPKFIKLLEDEEKALN